MSLASACHHAPGAAQSYFLAAQHYHVSCKALRKACRAFLAAHARAPSEPFLVVLKLPSSARVRFVGDLHCEIGALVHILRAEPLASDEHLVLCGDYISRGHYAMATLYAILCLWRTAPGRVHICRGNHECERMLDRYGSGEEVRTHCANEEAEVRRLLVAFFAALPVAVYVHACAPDGGCVAQYHCFHGMPPHASCLGTAALARQVYERVDALAPGEQCPLVLDALAERYFTWADVFSSQRRSVALEVLDESYLDTYRVCFSRGPVLMVKGHQDFYCALVHSPLAADEHFRCHMAHAYCPSGEGCALRFPDRPCTRVTLREQGAGGDGSAALVGLRLVILSAAVTSKTRAAAHLASERDPLPSIGWLHMRGCEGTLRAEHATDSTDEPRLFPPEGRVRLGLLDTHVAVSWPDGAVRRAPLLASHCGVVAKPAETVVCLDPRDRTAEVEASRFRESLTCTVRVGTDECVVRNCASRVHARELHSHLLAAPHLLPVRFNHARAPLMSSP